MKYYHIIMLILAVLLVVPLGSSEGDLFKLNNPADLRTTCYDGDKAYCDATTNCLITISYPNGATLLTDGVMTYHTSYYNYTLTANQINTLGFYHYSINCQNALYGDVVTGTFEVTNSGDASLGTNSIALVLILLVFSVMFMVVGFTIKPEKWLLKSVLYFIALLVMLLNLSLGIQMAQSANISSLMNTALIIGVSSIGLFIMYMFISYFIAIVRQFKNAKQQRNEDLL